MFRVLKHNNLQRLFQPKGPSSLTFSSVLHQASLTYCWYPVILLATGRCYTRTQHNDTAQHNATAQHNDTAQLNDTAKCWAHSSQSGVKCNSHISFHFWFMILKFTHSASLWRSLLMKSCAVCEMFLKYSSGNSTAARDTL